MEKIVDYIKPELLVLVAVLYFVGMAIKRSDINDRHIPLILGGCGVGLALLWVLATSAVAGWQSWLLAVFTAIVQGVLVAGASVYVNQLVKQGRKSGE